VQTGGSCQDDCQCPSGNCSQPGPIGPGPTCQPIPLGGACQDGSNDCSFGVSCSSDVCGGQGASCYVNRQCAPTLMCQGASVMNAGQCE
jgi:hypothetical protein